MLIYLAGEPAVVVSGLDDTAADAVLEAVNGYGRLGVPSAAGLSLLERIGEVPLRDAAPDTVAAVLYRNREALIPLVARLGLPGEEWLLTDDEETPPGDLLLTDVPVGGGEPPHAPGWAESEEAVEEIYTASGAIRKTAKDGIPRSQLRDLLQSEAVRALFGDMVDKDPEGVLNLLVDRIPRRKT